MIFRKSELAYSSDVNIVSGNSLLPLGSKPFPEPMLTLIYVTMWHHWKKVLTHKSRETTTSWLRSWFVACLIPSHNLIQCLLIVDRTVPKCSVESKMKGGYITKGSVLKNCLQYDGHFVSASMCSRDEDRIGGLCCHNLRKRGRC